MSEIGIFTPDQARLVWQDYLERQQLAPQISQNFPQRRFIDEPSPHRVFVRNAGDEEIPAYGCMEITGTEEVGGRTVVTVTKPTRVDGEYLFNSQYAISPASESSGSVGDSIGNGWAFRFGVVIMLGSPPSEPGASYGPIVGSWEIEETDGPFVVYGAHNAKDNALIGRIASSGGSGDYVAFEFVDSTSASSTSGSSSGDANGDGVPDRCDARDTATGPFVGRVIRKACGMGAVPGEDIDGLIELEDDLGILSNRDSRDITGRMGFAVRMKNEDASASIASSSGAVDDCYWMIVIVNFWRVVRTVKEIIVTEDSFVVKYHNLTVWDNCDLDDDVIVGTDCPLPSTSSSGSGSV